MAKRWWEMDILDGTRITQFYWCTGEPADNIMDGIASIGLRVAYHGKWDDIDANFSHGSICEKDIRFD